MAAINGNPGRQHTRRASRDIQGEMIAFLLYIIF